MAIHTAIYHRTTYQYDKKIQVFPHVVRLRPAPHCRTPILSYSFRVTPGQHFINWQQDPFGNFLARLVFEEETDQLEFTVDLIADLTPINPFDFFIEDAAETVPFRYETALRQELLPYLKLTDDSTRLDRLVGECSGYRGARTIDFLVEVNQKVCQAVGYQVRLEAGIQTCEETLVKGTGSCRDSAFLLVQLFRRLGLAARFVSGYLIQLVEDEKPLEGPEGPSADFTDLHAWTEVFVPGAGWIGLDPTSGLLAGEGHIPLAATPEPGSAAPIVGATEPAEAEFDFENTVTRVHEDPRVTKPYLKDEWKRIDRLGHEIDERLELNDIRLTMGGEPTFVSTEDMGGAEWNTEADSPFKRERAIDLTQRLYDAYAPKGLIWFGEGKWYPGEPVPRWAYGVFWRKDGEPMWQAREQLANPALPGDSTIDDAARLSHRIGEALGLDREAVLPAMEDIEYYRWEISKLPSAEEVGEASAEASLERRTLAALEQRGLDVPTGYVIPTFHSKIHFRWMSSRWNLRRGRLYLIPGASAMGLRLPLDSVREATAKDEIRPRSPLEKEWDPLPSDLLAKYASPPEGADLDSPNLQEWIPRTALTIEVREGRLHCFLPPCDSLESYLELLRGIEVAAEKESLAVIIEGYEPPPDPRIESLKVTPDPGVIEVNVQPAATWSDLVSQTSTLYNAARESRLGTQKFMLDGRHTGTGGGNHVVIGGRTPGDSPFLRRSDLLASLVGYWQHHPGLSYLFSSLSRLGS
ncbi:MAG: transglutaminase family protein [Verrucomicrobiota bacterium]